MSKIKIHAAPQFDFSTHWATLEVVHPIVPSTFAWGDITQVYASSHSLCVNKNVVRILLSGPRDGKRGNVMFTKEQLQEFISALSEMEQQL
jgi:hypothetical protein